MGQGAAVSCGGWAPTMYSMSDLQARALAQDGMPRSSSGLESMQSIEQALGNVEQDIMDKVAEDWMINHQNPAAGQPHQASNGNLRA